jgi:nucleotide-binding universal stress UspA family protein
VTVLHVLENISAESPDLEEEMNAVRGKFQELVAAAAIASMKIHLEVRQGEAYREILKLAAEKQSDMIVTGVQARNSLDLAVFGSTTDRLIQLYSGHVLTVPI